MRPLGKIVEGVLGVQWRTHLGSLEVLTDGLIRGRVDSALLVLLF